ncbi:hypothetical protein RUM43_002307 [Polyplax serrata]|uniref:Voltage-dependent anion-selective channel n=1 Tax=Polyplax serrata TaxID=468196 RepID=A0AAN8S4N6_POLSC
MAPPAYADLGKQARDVFGKGYHFGVLKLDVKTRTESGVEFSSGCVSNQEKGSVFGSLETKYRAPNYGLTFSERWNTDNVCITEVVMQDQLAKGLKLSADCSFAPQTRSKNGHLKAAFLHEACALNGDAEFSSDGQNVTASAVLGYQGVVGGYQLKFDLNNSKVIANNFALGYSQADFVLHTSVDNGEIYKGSIFHKVTPLLDAAVDLTWSTNSNETKFGIGCKYALEGNACVRAKVNNASQIGLGYQQKLRDGITITLSTLIDAKNFNQGGHKYGIGLEMEA